MAFEQVTSHLPEDSQELLDMSDLVLVIDNKHFPVHGQLMSTYSGFFRHMLFDLKTPINSQLSAVDTLTQGCSLKAQYPTKLQLKDVTAKELSLLLRYLYSMDHGIMEKMEDTKVLVDLAQRFDIPCIVRNCVPYVCRNAADLVMHMSDLTHSDAIYWLHVAEAWQLRPLKVSCMAAIADEISFFSIGEGEYWNGFDMTKVQKLNSTTLFVVARAVAEACSKAIVKKDVKERLCEFERIITKILDQEEDRQRTVLSRSLKQSGKARSADGDDDKHRGSLPNISSFASVI